MNKSEQETSERSQSLRDHQLRADELGLRVGASVSYHTPSLFTRYGCIKKLDLHPLSRALVITSNGEHWVDLSWLRPEPGVTDPVSRDYQEVYGAPQPATRECVVDLPAVVLHGALALIQACDAGLDRSELRDMCHSDREQDLEHLLWVKESEFTRFPTMTCSSKLILGPINHLVYLRHSITGRGGHICHYTQIATQSWDHNIPEIYDTELDEGLDYFIKVKINISAR